MSKTNTVVRFNNSNKEFFSELKKRIDSYFKDNQISKNGNLNMIIKTIFMFSAYLVPYFLLLFNVFESKLIWYFLSIIMGFAMAGLGLCVMHDANHGSLSKNTRVNKFIGYVSLNLLGGYSLNWRIQHNVIHHTFTNVHGHDEDIDPPAFMRFEPHAERKALHKLQFIYAWILYGLMTLMWSTTKDFQQLTRYNKKGLLKGANTTFERELPLLILSKIGYFAYMLLPLFLIPNLSILEWILGFLTMHYFAGLVLAMIFQPAHVVEVTEFPLPDDKGSIENHWAEHQLRTTMNFATKDPVFTWLVGGLNYQVEHHLFPTICHVHYPQISKIVEQTAKDFNLPYKNEKTFAGALWSHEIMLWKLGRA
jgi:linoleoyl-CoA desaturase